jgi:hypothetical protein
VNGSRWCPPSTAAQVHDHEESTRLQYGLAERAVDAWAGHSVISSCAGVNQPAIGQVGAAEQQPLEA